MPLTTNPNFSNSRNDVDRIIDSYFLQTNLSGILSIGVEKTTKLYREKKKYLHELSYDDAKKVHGFITDDIQFGSGYYFYEGKQFSDGATFIYKPSADDSSRDPMKDENVGLDDFKGIVKLAYIAGSRLLDSDVFFERDQYYLMVQMRTPERRWYVMPSYYTNNVNRKGFYKSLNSNNKKVIAYYVPDVSIRFLFISHYHEGRQHVESIPIDFSGSGNLSEIMKPLYIQIFERIMRSVRAQSSGNRNHPISESRSPNNNSKKHLSKKNGAYVSHNVPFSCEIECYAPSKNEMANFIDTVSTDIGYCRDGSLTSDIGYPIEMQTPILLGKRGEILIAEICTELISRNFKVDKTCGLHIHLDGTNLNLNELHKNLKVPPQHVINLYLAYRLFDDVIVSFLPSTRRQNRYCSSFIDGASHNEHSIEVDSIAVSIERMKGMRSIRDFEHYWYKSGGNYDRVARAKASRYTVSRYFGINFHSLLAHNHLEIRYHSGTLNYEKIMYWIDLHGKIIERVVDGSITMELIEELVNGNYPLEDLTKIMFTILRLPEETESYLYERQAKFKDVVASEEILINKTKKVDTY